MKRENITKAEFEKACEALWEELQYQDALARRTDDEAQNIPGFLTLARRYIRRAEDDWADSPGEGNPPQVPAALHGLRKLAAIFVRAMIYNGVRRRGSSGPR